MLAEQNMKRDHHQNMYHSTTLSPQGGIPAGHYVIFMGISSGACGYAWHSSHATQLVARATHRDVYLVHLFGPLDGGRIVGCSNPRTPVQHVVVDGAGAAIHEDASGVGLDVGTVLAPNLVELARAGRSCTTVDSPHVCEEMIVQLLLLWKRHMRAEIDRQLCWGWFTRCTLLLCEDKEGGSREQKDAGTGATHQELQWTGE